jgi:hypothetical protein
MFQELERKIDSKWNSDSQTLGSKNGDNTGQTMDVRAVWCGFYHTNTEHHASHDGEASSNHEMTRHE